MKIFIDFDDTLFNSRKFKKYFENVFIGEGISRKNLRKTYDQVKKDGVYSLEKHINLLHINFGTDKKVIRKKLKKLFSELSFCVYTDSWEFVKKFSRKDLIILSFGQHSFQRKKIVGSKISKKVLKIIITQNRKIGTIHDFIEKYNFRNEKIFFIDNKAEFLEKIEEMDHKILTIQMIRNDFEKIARHADYRANNLKEVLKIIKKEKMA